MAFPSQAITRSRPIVLALFACSLFGAMVALGGRSQSTSTQSNDKATSQAAAKAAARRKNFDALKRQLEDSDGTSRSSDTQPSPPGLLISPAQVGMLAHEEQKFTLLDGQGHNLKEKADWSLSDSYVADLIDGQVPTIIAKESGTVTLTARVGNLTGQAEIKVYPGDKFPIGAVRWVAPQIPGYTTKQVVQASPR